MCMSLSFELVVQNACDVHACLFALRVLRVMFRLSLQLLQSRDHLWMMRRNWLFYTIVFPAWRRTSLAFEATRMCGSPRLSEPRPERSSCLGSCGTWVSNFNVSLHELMFFRVHLCMLAHSAFCADVNLIPREEKEHISIRMNCLTQQDLEAGGFFWMDRARAIVLAMVQDRVNQILRVLRQARSSLADIWAVMFPLYATPSTFLGILVKFRDVGHFKELVGH